MVLGGEAFTVARERGGGGGEQVLEVDTLLREALAHDPRVYSVRLHTRRGFWWASRRTR